MLQILRDLPIKVKIFGFIVPSTIAFGILMTCLAIFYLHNLNDASVKSYHQTIEQIVNSAQNGDKAINTDQLLAQIKDKNNEKISNITTILVTIVSAVIIFASIGALIIAHFIGKPIKDVSQGFENLSSGDADLTKRLATSSDDETGRVSKYFNLFIDKIHTIIKNIQQNSIDLGRACSTITTLIDTIDQRTGSSRDQAQTVFRSAGYMSKDMNEVSQILEASSTNVKNITLAVSELNDTVIEISKTSAKAQQNTDQAKTIMDGLEQEVNDLGKAGAEISKVTESITEISEQVNLLALNATIEAARAGEAGKGFAVVANEIKELANQTSSAAQEIQEKSAQVEKVTLSTIAQIEEAAIAVSENTDVVTTIASAVEQQAATVNEISHSLGESSEKLDYSSETVSKASNYADDIAKMANDVTEAILEVDEAVQTISATSDNLNQLSADSGKLAEQFRT